MPHPVREGSTCHSPHLLHFRAVHAPGSKRGAPCRLRTSLTDFISSLRSIRCLLLYLRSPQRAAHTAEIQQQDGVTRHQRRLVRRGSRRRLRGSPSGIRAPSADPQRNPPVSSLWTGTKSRNQQAVYRTDHRDRTSYRGGRSDEREEELDHRSALLPRDV